MAKQYDHASCSKVMMLTLNNQVVLEVRKQVEKQAVSAL